MYTLNRYFQTSIGHLFGELAMDDTLGTVNAENNLLSIDVVEACGLLR